MSIDSDDFREWAGDLELRALMRGGEQQADHGVTDDARAVTWPPESQASGIRDARSVQEVLCEMEGKEKSLRHQNALQLRYMLRAQDRARRWRSLFWAVTGAAALEFASVLWLWWRLR